MPQPTEEQQYIQSAMDGRFGTDQQQIANIGLTLLMTLLKKNRDYGSSVFSPPVLAPDMTPDRAMLVRMSDKVARLANLFSGKEQQIKDESIRDTMRDLAGYAILWLSRPMNEPELKELRKQGDT